MGRVGFFLKPPMSDLARDITRPQCVYWMAHRLENP